MPVGGAFRILGTALFLALGCHAFSASQYIAGRAGDSALFREAVTGREIRALIDQERNGWLHYTEFAGLGPLWVAAGNRDETIYVRAPADRSFQLLADFSAALGHTARIELGPCNRGTAVLAARERLEVPAGGFDDAVRIDFAPSCADSGVTSAWFARGVGPIQWTATTIAGPVTYQLVTATIAGVPYPRPTGVSLTAEFPAPKVWIDMMPPFPPPGTLDVFLTVRNDTEVPITYTFATGQLFEIEIADSAGKVVSRWSRGKAFIQAVQHRTIAPGTSRRFGGAVSLAGDDGRALPQGSYTIRIYLMSLHPAGISPPLCSAPIEIGWAY